MTSSKAPVCHRTWCNCKCFDRQRGVTVQRSRNVRGESALLHPIQLTAELIGFVAHSPPIGLGKPAYLQVQHRVRLDLIQAETIHDHRYRCVGAAGCLDHTE